MKFPENYAGCASTAARTQRDRSRSPENHCSASQRHTSLEARGRATTSNHFVRPPPWHISVSEIGPGHPSPRLIIMPSLLQRDRNHIGARRTKILSVLSHVRRISRLRISLGIFSTYRNFRVANVSISVTSQYFAYIRIFVWRISWARSRVRDLFPRRQSPCIVYHNKVLSKNILYRVDKVESTVIVLYVVTIGIILRTCVW